MGYAVFTQVVPKTGEIEGRSRVPVGQKAVGEWGTESSFSARICGSANQLTLNDLG